MVFNQYNLFAIMREDSAIKFRDNFPSNLISDQKKNLINKFNNVVDNIAEFYEFLNFHNRILPRSFDTRSAMTIQEYLALIDIKKRKLNDTDIVYFYSFYNNFEQFHWNHEICFRILINIDYDHISDQCVSFKYYRYFDTKQTSIETYDIIYCGKLDSEDEYANLIVKIADAFATSLFECNYDSQKSSNIYTFLEYNQIDEYLGLLYWWDIFTSLLHAGLLNKYPNDLFELSEKYYNINGPYFNSNKELVNIINKIINANSSMNYEEETIDIKFIEENFCK